MVVKLRVCLSILVLLVLPVSSASAQAWVEDPGDLSIELHSSYQTSQGVWHGPTLVTGVPAQILSFAVSASYVPIEHLGVGLALNANAARYSGPQAIPGNTSIILAHGSQDDGSFHGNLTDLDLDARYQVYDGAVAVSPVIRFHLPVTNYENRGYAMAGTHLKELGLGFSLGRAGLGIESLFLQVGYAFTITSKETRGGAGTEQYRTNRSDADLSLAYQINDKLLVAVGAAFRYTHDGFDLEDYPTLPAGDPLITWHDPVLKVAYFAPSAQVSYQLTEAWSLSGQFGAVVWGQNASNPLSFGLNVGWGRNLKSDD